MDIISFIDSRLEAYEKLRSILYSTIDITHYSPNNLKIFKQIEDLFVRTDELYQIRMRLT